VVAQANGRQEPQIAPRNPNQTNAVAQVQQNHNAYPQQQNHNAFPQQLNPNAQIYQVQGPPHSYFIAPPPTASVYNAPNHLYKTSTVPTPLIGEIPDREPGWDQNAARKNNVLCQAPDLFLEVNGDTPPVYITGSPTTDIKIEFSLFCGAFSWTVSEPRLNGSHIALKLILRQNDKGIYNGVGSHCGQFKQEMASESYIIITSQTRDISMLDISKNRFGCVIKE